MKVTERRFRIKVGDKYLLHDPAYCTTKTMKLGALDEALLIGSWQVYRFKWNIVDAGFDEKIIDVQTVYIEVDA